MTQVSEKKGAQHHVQSFGRFLSGMVMPNIGAFIAWGLITALFIPTGWVPNENLAVLVGPMIVYLLPLLIGYTGGKMIYGTRGGVLGAIATMGVVVGTSIPMFIGGMIMGPLAGWVIKKFDESVDGKIPTGFEMLINNFSAGIIGMGLTLLSYVIIGPAVEAGSAAVSGVVQAIVDAGLLPVASIVIEPAKVIFLNNALNHGIFTPLGAEQVTETGKSIFFLLEANPGPGLGVLAAVWVFSKGMLKQSAPGAIIIHFLGGIHEIYFPYILMQPKLLLAVIAGGASGVLTEVILDAGLVAAASPGSIFAVMAMAPKGGLLPVLAGVLVASVVSFLVASVFIDKSEADDDSFEAAKSQMVDLKGKSSSVVKTSVDTLPAHFVDPSVFKRIAVACDAGMGSSAMGASKLKAAVKKAGGSAVVFNCAIDQLKDDVDLVITHQQLTDRAKSKLPTAEHISISDFIMTGLYTDLAAFLGGSGATVVEEVVEEASSTTLTRENIRIGLPTTTKEEAIRLAGQILVDGGYVEPGYVDAMVQRDSELTTFIGNGTAIPHGVADAKKKIKHTGISVLQYPDGVDFDGNTVYLVVGIAGIGNEHLTILANLAEIVEDEAKVELLRTTKETEFIYKQFTN